MYEVPCDICGESEKRVLFDRARNNEQVKNVICQHCGLVYISPREDDDCVKDHYASGTFSIQARGSNYPTTKKFNQSEMMALNRFRVLCSAVDLQSIHTGRLLEIGCGVGSFLRLMKGAGWDVLGLEPDTIYAESGKQNYSVSIQSQMYEEVNFPDHFFDMVATFHVIEHVISPKAFLEKVSKDLKVGGLLYLETPCIERPYGGNLENFFWKDHLYTFSKNTLLGLLQQLGFQIIRANYVNDFLWVLGKKGESLLENPPSYPLDDPDKVWHHTHKLYRKFLSQHKTTNTHRKMGKVGQISVNMSLQAIHKLRYQSNDFLPAVCRQIKSQIASSDFLRLPIKRYRGKYIAHFGLHSPGNAGDTLLFVAVRKLIDKVNGPYNWSLEPLWSEVSDKMISRLNTESRGVVIGGGGILLRDTNPNQNSGWQWNCSIEHLRQIEVPIVVFSIGYNRFRGQEDFDTIFKSHIRELIRHSAFFGLRNHGSIRELTPYLDENLASKLCFQPCPTTLLRYIYPKFDRDCVDNRTQRLALNVSFDRRVLRFCQKEDEILKSIARAMRWANKDGWEINVVNHLPDDANIIPWLIHEGVTFHEIRLDGRPKEEILNFYQKIPLTIGMRGHSQMIPFGLCNGIISLISHNKLAYFLEDINHPEWGVEIGSPNLEEQLVEKIQFFDANRDMIKDQIIQAQEILWDITHQNLEVIKRAF